MKNPDHSFELIQVVWDISDSKTLKREQRALEKAEQELGIRGKIISPQEYVRNYLKQHLINS